MKRLYIIKKYFQKHIYQGLFDMWNIDKKNIHHSEQDLFHIDQREIRYVKLGINIGYEQNGKQEFRRPVLVIKKIGSLFLCVPLTSKLASIKGHTAIYYHILQSIKNIQPSALILSQVRVLDKKRFISYLGKVSEEEFFGIKEKARDLRL